MDWSKGFSARYYMTIMDTKTWSDSGHIDIVDGSINRTTSGLRHSADVTCVNYDRSKERWIRIWLDARQNGESYHGALFTGIASSPSRELNGFLETNKLECYSVLKPAEDILLPRGWYASSGVNGAEMIRSLLKSCSIPAPIYINYDGDYPALYYTIIAEDGETYLSMVEKIIDAINWRLVIEGDGSIYILPESQVLSATFDSLENDCVEPSISIENNWFDCPNVFRAIMGDMVSVAVDTSEDSILSVSNRGREIWMEEKNCNLYDGETLDSYAKRRLSEEQSIYYTISYTRRYDPSINVTDVVRLNYPAQNINGAFYITSQTINLGYGASVSEEGSMING